MNTPTYLVDGYGSVGRVFFDPTLTRIHMLMWLFCHPKATDEEKIMIEWRLEAIMQDQDMELPTC